MGNEPSKKIQACDLLGMSSFWGILGLIGVISFLRQLNSAYLGEFLPVMGTLLQQMDAQNGGEPIGRPTTLGAGLGIVGLDQINQCFPRHNIFHLAQKSFSFGALFGSGLHKITESKLLAAHEPSHLLRSQRNCRVVSPGYPELP